MTASDTDLLLDYARRLYCTVQPRPSTYEGKQLLITASDQLAKYINWLEREAGKLPNNAHPPKHNNN